MNDCKADSPIDLKALDYYQYIDVSKKFYIYKTMPLLGKICAPILINPNKFGSHLLENFDSIIHTASYVIMYISDTQKIYVYYIIIAAFAAVSSILLLIIFRFLAGIIIWVMVISIILIFLGIGLFCYFQRQNIITSQVSESE